MQVIGNYFTIFLVSFRLGLTSFGGPIAHLSYFHHEYVLKKQWLNEKQFGEIVAIAQFLPGPTSSQVGFAIGMKKGGTFGGILSFIGFTLPSSIILILFGTISFFTSDSFSDLIHMLKLVTVAVVAQAILSMMKSFTPDIFSQSLALLSICALFLIPSPSTQIAVIVSCGCISWLFYKKMIEVNTDVSQPIVSKRVGVIATAVFIFGLLAIPLINLFFPVKLLTLFEQFYQTGAFVFGGGHVMLPLLEQQFVQSNLLNEEHFLAGYGLTQAMPGPLFTFSGFIGAELHGILGGIIATLAIFLPGLLLMLAILPLWQKVSSNVKYVRFVMGVNASVVGILITSFFTPIWQSSVITGTDFVIVFIMFYMIQLLKLPVWSIILLGIGISFII